MLNKYNFYETDNPIRRKWTEDLNGQRNKDKIQIAIESNQSPSL